MPEPENRSPDDSANGAESFLRFLQNPRKPQEMVDNAYGSQEERDHINDVMSRALGDFNLSCSNCGGLCIHQQTEIRDRLMRRMGDLVIRLSEGIDLYFRTRSFGLGEPSPIIRRIYDAIDELTVIYDHAEPQQEMMEDGGFEGDGSEDEDDDE